MDARDVARGYSPPTLWRWARVWGQKTITPAHCGRSPHVISHRQTPFTHLKKYCFFSLEKACFFFFFLWCYQFMRVKSMNYPNRISSVWSSYSGERVVGTWDITSVIMEVVVGYAAWCIRSYVCHLDDSKKPIIVWNSCALACKTQSRCKMIDQ